MTDQFQRRPQQSQPLPVDWNLKIFLTIKKFANCNSAGLLINFNTKLFTSNFILSQVLVFNIIFKQLSWQFTDEKIVLEARSNVYIDDFQRKFRHKIQ